MLDGRSRAFDQAFGAVLQIGQARAIAFIHLEIFWIGACQRRVIAQVKIRAKAQQPGIQVGDFLTAGTGRPFLQQGQSLFHLTTVKFCIDVFGPNVHAVPSRNGSTSR